MSGRVSPFTGASPADIVMLYNTWNPNPEMIATTRNAPTRSFASLGRVEAAHEHEQVQRQRDEHADEAVLLGQDGVDEIVVRHGQESVAALGALAEALARQAARPDGHLGLDLLVAGASADRSRGLRKVSTRSF